MAVEVEAAGQVDEFLRVLRRRIWWIVVPFVVIGSVGCFFAVVVPKKYVSETEVMVHNLGEVTGQFGQNASAIEGQVARYNVTSHARVDSVLNTLRWPDYQPLGDADRHEYREKLLTDLSVKLPTMPRDSGQQRVEIIYKDTSPEKATEFLAALLKSWTTEVLNRHLEREEKELAETKDKFADSQKRLQSINEEIAAIRTEFRITPDRQSGDFRGQAPVHPDFTSWERTNTDIDGLELDIDEAERQYELKHLKWARMPQFDTEVADVNMGPLEKQLDKIALEIQAVEFQIQENKWSSGHSRRIQADNKIEVLKDQRRTLIENAERTDFGQPDELPDSPEWMTLKEELEVDRDKIDSDKRRLVSLKDKQLELRGRTDRLQQATKDIENYDNQARILREGLLQLGANRDKLEIAVRTLDSPQGNPFEIHLQPTRPTKPTAPNPWVYSIGSIIAGLGLGLGLAVLKEYSRSCFRSGRELSRVMTHPVLGTVNTIRTRRERARTLLVRGILGGGSLLFALSVGYVTWAWAKKPDALTDSLRDAIDGFQRMLM